jgi:protein TonB
VNAVEADRPNHSGRILSVAFVVAVAINLALLLLIGALISQRETQLALAPNPQSVDFIRIEPKPEEPKPVPPPEIKRVIDASSEPSQAEKRSAPGPIKPSSAASPGRPSRTGAPKTGKAKVTSAAAAGVAAPRIDIPEKGTGPAFASVPGSDSRLTAPPAQWNPEKTPGDDQESTDGTGSGGSYSQGLVVLSRVLPRYPPRAEARGIEGWVLLEITVTPAGTVSDAKVVDASPKEIFDQAALEAIRRWRFKPAFREGRTVAQRATLKLRFRLEKQR